MSQPGWRAKAAPAAKTLLHRTGVYEVLRRVAPSRALGILRYHAICGPEGYSYADRSICVTPGAFERHVAYLAAHYRVLPLPEAAAALARGKSLPTNALAITFDDGYADNLPAARVLSRHGVSATFYLTAGCLGGERPFWLAEIRTLVGSFAGEVLRLTVGGQPVELPCRTPHEKQVTQRKLSRLFKSHTVPERERLREELRSQAQPPPSPDPMLTWDQVREMHGLGMTIGAHTLTHANLPSAGPADARHEIVASRQRLEQEIGAPVTMFSYPNGGAERYFTPEVRQLVVDAGFAAATTSRNGFARPGDDVYGLSRIQIAERLEDLVFALEVERFAFVPRGR